MYSPIKLVLTSVNPPTTMVLPALNDFTYLTLINDEITNYSTSVKWDFLRSMFVENVCSPCDVHSVTMYADDIRNADDISEFEMNDSKSSREFATNLINKNGNLIKYMWITTICMIHTLRIVLGKTSP